MDALNALLDKSFRAMHEFPLAGPIARYPLSFTSYSHISNVPLLSFPANGFACCQENRAQRGVIFPLSLNEKLARSQNVIANNDDNNLVDSLFIHKPVTVEGEQSVGFSGLCKQRGLKIVNFWSVLVKFQFS